MRGTCRARRDQGPETQQSWAIHLSPGVGDKGWMAPGVHSHWIDAPRGDLATWPERCGHPVWWQGG